MDLTSIVTTDSTASTNDLKGSPIVLIGICGGAFLLFFAIFCTACIRRKRRKKRKKREVQRTYNSPDVFKESTSAISEPGIYTLPKPFTPPPDSGRKDTIANFPSPDIAGCRPRRNNPETRAPCPLPTVNRELEENKPSVPSHFTGACQQFCIDNGCRQTCCHGHQANTCCTTVSQLPHNHCPIHTETNMASYRQVNLMYSLQDNVPNCNYPVCNSFSTHKQLHRYDRRLHRHGKIPVSGFASLPSRCGEKAHIPHARDIMSIFHSPSSMSNFQETYESDNQEEEEEEEEVEDTFGIIKNNPLLFGAYMHYDDDSANRGKLRPSQPTGSTRSPLNNRQHVKMISRENKVHAMDVFSPKRNELNIGLSDSEDYNTVSEQSTQREQDENRIYLEVRNSMTNDVKKSDNEDDKYINSDAYIKDPVKKGVRISIDLK